MTPQYRPVKTAVLASILAVLCALIGSSPTSAASDNPTARGSMWSYRFITKAWNGNPARWNPCAPIDYKVNTRYATRGALSDTKRAVARVSATTGLRFVYRGSTRVVPGSRHGDRYPSGIDLVVAWAKPWQSDALRRSPGAAGVGGVSWTTGYDRSGRTTPRIVQGRVILNANVKLRGGFWSARGGSRGELLMHEIGHAVGLTHPRQQDRWQIMYPTLTGKPALWGAGDRSGLWRVGRTRGCVYRSRPGTTMRATQSSTQSATMR